MLAIEDEDFGAATEALRKAGFRDLPWSYGFVQDPRSIQNTHQRRLHDYIARQHQNLDKNSRQFQFPAESGIAERVLLLRSSYVHLSLLSTPRSSFVRDKDIYYPNAVLLLESFIRTIIQEPEQNGWSSTLEMWAITYLYGQLMLGDDVFDLESDGRVKSWFNRQIRRYDGGIDRTTITKRTGKISGSTTYLVE